MRNRLCLLAAAPLGLIATPALAQTTPAATDYSTLTNAVDFASVITALLAVAAVLVGVLIVRKGIRFVMGAIK